MGIAQWDIKGSALCAPVYQMPGGKCRNKVRKPGNILAIDELGYADHALTGGMMLACAEERRLRAFAVNGAPRDVDDILNSTLPYLLSVSTERRPP